MQQIISERQDAPRKRPAQIMRATERERASGIETWPTPGELYFEAGIVLAVALGAGVIVQLVMGSG